MSYCGTMDGAVDHVLKDADKIQVLFWPSVVLLAASGILLPSGVAFLRENYSWVAQYISELGAVGAPYATVINYFGFLVVAASSGVALFGLMRRSDVNRLAAVGCVLWIIGLSVGYLSAFLFPCDLGCPLDGSARQSIHNLSVLIAYPAGTMGLLCIAIGLRQVGVRVASTWAFGVALLSVVGFVMMAHPDQSHLRGLWQRIADYSMFALIAGLGAVLPKTPSVTTKPS